MTRLFAWVAHAYEVGESENHGTFAAVELLDSIEFTLQRIGGSNAQRDIVARTRAHHHAHLSESTDVADPTVEPTIALEAT